MQTIEEVVLLRRVGVMGGAAAGRPAPWGAGAGAGAGGTPRAGGPAPGGPRTEQEIGARYAEQRFRALRARRREGVSPHSAQGRAVTRELQHLGATVTRRLARLDASTQKLASASSPAREPSPKA